MRKSLLPLLRCLKCLSSKWELSVDSETSKEIREGSISCSLCRTSYKIHEGIVDTLIELPQEVAREKTHLESSDYLKTSEDKGYPINRETITSFKQSFLALPRGDGSDYFKSGGTFENQAGNADRFFKTLDSLQLTGKEQVLELGASFGWGSFHLAQRGCSVVALDITNYLMASDIYLEQKDVYFERIMGDMSKLPFKDRSFDIIFSHSVIHHCKNLDRLFTELYRVLRPNGKVVALQECALGIFEDKSGKALKDAIHEGFNENAYTLPQWKKGAMLGGFKRVDFHFFRWIDDYVYKKRLRHAPETAKLKLAAWIQSHPRLNALINRLSIGIRILFRPKSWMMIASK